MKLLFACALALASSAALARDVHCDRHIENGHTLQKCEFVESPQAAVPPPAPPVQIAPPQHTCFATGRLGIFSETAASLVIGAVDPNQPVTVLALGLNQHACYRSAWLGRRAIRHLSLTLGPHYPRAGVAGVYNRAVYLKEKTDALARWADYLIAAVATT